MNNTITDFIDFFKNIAEKNIDINHSQNEPHFFRGELEEMFYNLRNTTHFPCLCLENFELNYNDEGNNKWKERSSAFSIVNEYFEKNDYDEYDKTFSTCEEIGDEVIRKILEYCTQDNHCPISFENIHATPFINTEMKYGGIRYEFSIKEPFNEEPNPAKWQ